MLDKMAVRYRVSHTQEKKNPRTSSHLRTIEKHQSVHYECFWTVRRSQKTVAQGEHCHLLKKCIVRSFSVAETGYILASHLRHSDS